MKKVVRFYLSHDVNAGYSFGDEMSEVIPERQTQDWIKSYISAITAYASDGRYLSKGLDSTSYFTKDGYAVAIRSYANRDDRLFLESEVIVANTNLKEVPYSNLIPRNVEFKDRALRDAVRLAVLTAFLGENTKLYCIADDGDSMIDCFCTTAYGFNQKILNKNAVVEAIADIPPVFSPVFLCRCIEPADYETFYKRASRDNNSIIIDFKKTKQIKYNLCAPTFAQNFLLELTAKYGFETVCAAFENGIGRSVIQDAPSRSCLFNAWVYLCVESRFRGDGCKLSMTPEEKEDLERILK